MTVSTIKAERVVNTALGLLERATPLPAFVWRDAGGDFRGAKGDAITIRLPAYVKSRKRSLRAGTPRSEDSLVERTVIVTLDSNLYNKVPITDEELTLDIERFNDQILVPVLSGIGRGIEDELIDAITGASYPVAHDIAIDPADPYAGCVDARRLLNNARVPMSERFIACGSEVEAQFLLDDKFVRADASGTTSTMREGVIGRVAGFDVVSIPGLPVDEAYACHRTAFALSTRAPIVPQGAPWGASQSWNGYSIRVVQALDPDELVNNFHADVYVGVNPVTDFGSFTSGLFEPATNPDLDHDTPVLVRAVKMTLAAS